MLTPGACLVVFRIGLACGATACGLALLGWLGLPDGAPGLMARTAMLYATTLLAFAALPRMRRDDLACAAVALAGAVEAVHALSLRQVAPTLLAADACGVIAAWAPAAVEQYRRLARGARYVPFRDLAVADRRRTTRRERPAPAMR